MQCSSCGNVLSPGIRICPACGALAPLPSSVAPPPFPARTTSFYDEQIPFTDRETPVTPPSSPLLPVPLAPPALPIRTGEMYASPLPTITAPPSQPSRLLVITSASSIIALFIIGVLVFLLIRATTANNNSNSANKQASSTQTSSSTTNDPQALYNQVIGTKPVLDDAFNSVNSNNWVSGTTTEGSTCTVASDALQATATQGNSSLCALSTTNVSNFACQVQTTLTQGDSIGLIFRANTTTLNIYVLEISTQGNYILESGQNSAASTKSLSQGSSSVLKMGYGQPNLLTIIARGSTIYIYFNKQFIVQVNDNTSSSGLVGVLSSGSISNVPVNAAFSHFQLWNL